jgi:hypothetical protein
MRLKSLKQSIYQVMLENPRSLYPPVLQSLTLFCQFRQKIIWDGYIIRLLPKTFISAILLENKCLNP